jgi:DNA-binding FadR family transcriptional regulator
MQQVVYIRFISGLAEEPNKSEEPLYLQVVRALKDEIVKGVHPVGSQLPTEEELCQRFSVSRYTVREALRLLREDHLDWLTAESRRLPSTPIRHPDFVIR